MATKRIYLSPSNQVNNVGVGGYNESVQMHILAEKVASYLKNPMFKVKISQSNWTLKQVVDDSNDWGADRHICLHSDAYNSNAEGTTVFVCTTEPSTYDFAKILYQNIAAISPGRDRGLQIRKDLYELNETNCDAVLAENFFHTNAAEVEHWLRNVDKYAKAIAQAVYTFYGVPFDGQYKEVAKQAIAVGYKAKMQRYHEITLKNKLKESERLW